MSNMLEQAIVDAQSLREAAIKNAESEIVEKYSDEVREAVTKLLEQDDELDLGLDDEEQVDSTAMEQVPMAHVSDGAEDIVEVDLDDIIAAAQDDNDDEEFEMGREEIADEIGIDLTADEPGNRDDEDLAIDEGDLVDLFKELLVLDVPEKAVEDSMEEISRDEVEADEEEVSQDTNVSIERVEGMEKEDSEEYLKTKEKNESLNRENKNLKDLLESLKSKLEELHTQNTRLLYTNRVYENTSLNERQKDKIAEAISNAGSVTEAKTIYDTLQSTVEAKPKRSPQSLSEAIGRRNTVLRATRQEAPACDPFQDRMKKLAGIQ